MKFNNRGYGYVCSSFRSHNAQTAARHVNCASSIDQKISFRPRSSDVLLQKELSGHQNLRQAPTPKYTSPPRVCMSMLPSHMTGPRCIAMSGNQPGCQLFWVRPWLPPPPQWGQMGMIDARRARREISLTGSSKNFLALINIGHGYLFHSYTVWFVPNKGDGRVPANKFCSVSTFCLSASSPIELTSRRKGFDGENGISNCYKRQSFT